MSFTRQPENLATGIDADWTTEFLRDLERERGRIPHDLSAEIAVIGSVVRHGGETLDRIAQRGGIDANDFALLKHREIYSVCGRMHENGETVTIVTVCRAFQDHKEITFDNLRWLAEHSETPSVAGDYAPIIKGYAEQRRASMGADDGRAGYLPYVMFGESCVKRSNHFLVKGVLPRNGLGCVYGPSGEGKTFVTLDLMLHIATGKDWRGHRTKRAGVLYLAPDGGHMVENRLEAYKRHHGIKKADFVLVPCPIDLLGKISRNDADKVIELVNHIEAAHGFKIEVVCLDTVSRAMPGGNENAAEDMTALIANMARIQNGTDRLLVAIHHTPKNDAAVMRGHSSLHGAADCEINVNERCIKIAKQRDGADGAEYGFDLQVVELGEDEDGDAITSCVAVDANKPNKPNKQPTGAAKIAFDLLQRAIEEVGEMIAPYGGKSEHFRCVRTTLWKEYCDQGSISKTNTPDARRIAFKRAADSLQATGFINVWEPWVWIPNKTNISEHSRTCSLPNKRTT